MSSKYRIKQSLSNDPEGGDWDTWTIMCDEGEDGLITVAQCYDQTWANTVLSSSRWLEQAENGNISDATELVKINKPKRRSSV